MGGVGVLSTFGGQESELNILTAIPLSAETVFYLFLLAKIWSRSQTFRLRHCSCEYKLHLRFQNLF